MQEIKYTYLYLLNRENGMVLDTEIRDWVLLPIMVVMVLVGILRHQATLLLNTEPKKPSLKEIKESKALLRANILRINGKMLCFEKYNFRKLYLVDSFKKGNYLKAPIGESDADKSKNLMGDPANMDSMMDGLKKNMAMVVPQTLIMGWINFFFSVNLPFPLTLRFKSMLQRGIETYDMDVTWVSSLSWYFLNLFGLRGVFAIILAADGMKDMQAMSTMGMPTGGGMPGQQVDMNKIFKGEAENLELNQHTWDLEDIEQRILNIYS